MTRGKQTTVLALTGAVALASGAYALGSQAGDGSAEAAKTSSGQARDEVRFGHGFGPGRLGGPGLRPGFEDLADRLGVDEADLREALDDMAAERKADLAQRLADALNIDRAKVEQAFENVRPERPARPRVRRPQALAAALAKELGLSTAKVRAALEKRRGHPGDPGDLADDLGVSEEKLREAFHAVFDKLRPRLPGRPGLDNLAKELGVTQAQLEAAFEKLRAERDDRRDEFAKELADRLNIDVTKVQDALDDLHPPDFGRHHP
jgi:transcriptional regulator with XRE-family HTH domain